MCCQKIVTTSGVDMSGVRNELPEDLYAACVAIKTQSQLFLMIRD